MHRWTTRESERALGQQQQRVVGITLFVQQVYFLMRKNDSIIRNSVYGNKFTRRVVVVVVVDVTVVKVWCGGIVR